MKLITKHKGTNQEIILTVEEHNSLRGKDTKGKTWENLGQDDCELEIIQMITDEDQIIIDQQEETTE